MERLLSWAYALTEHPFSYTLRPLLLNRTKALRHRVMAMLPNIISLTRVPLGILVWIGFSCHWPWWTTLSAFAAGIISDRVDGSIARIVGTTKSGAIVDPVCDKIFFGLCAWANKAKFGPAAFWSVVAVELFILAAPPAIIKLRKLEPVEADFKSNIYGKSKFTLEMAAVALAITGFAAAATGVLWLATAFAVASIAKKISDSRMLFRKGNTLAAG